MILDRQKRFEENIRRVVSDFVTLKSNRLSMITITEIKSSKNFSQINVFFLVLPEEQEQKVLEFLQRKSYEIKKYIISKIKMKKTPEINFFLDCGQKNFHAIEKILN